MSSREEFAILQCTLFNLRIHNVWPRKGQAFHRPKSFSVLFILSIISYLPIPIGSFAHLIINIKRKNLEILAEDIAVLSSVTGSNYLLILFYLKQNQLAHLYNDLSNFEKFGKPDNFDKANKKLNILSFIYGTYCLVGVMIYAFASYLQIPKCERMKVELNFEETCGLFVPAWFPFAIDYFPVKQLLLLLQGYSAIMITRGSATVSFSTFETSQHIIIRLRHLKRLLLQVFDAEGYEERRRRLNFCIKYHIEVVQNYNDLDACYSGAMGIHITITGVIFGCITNQLVQGLNLGALIHLVGWFIALYLVCAGGQSLLSESSSLATSAYLSNWSTVETDLKRDLQLVILRSQRPFRLHASFEVLSLELFIAIIKKSYSYMTMLNQTTNHTE